MHEALDNWLSYTLSDTSIPLVKVALSHAEFEAIHPFGDGNGRLGRILIPLTMWQYGLIPKPVFNISDRLEDLRDDYIDRLLAVSRCDDWTGWCEFFFQIIEIQATNDLTKMKRIMSLYDNMKGTISKVSGSKYDLQVLDWIFKRPTFTTKELVSEVGIPSSSARLVIAKLKGAEILVETEVGKGRIPSKYEFSEFWSMSGDKS